MGEPREDVALIGNDRVIGRVRGNGVLEDVFFPSKGFYRHILRSQFGVFLPDTGEMSWLSEGWTATQDYLEDTFIAEGLFSHPSGLHARLVDLVPPDQDVFVRSLTLRNTRSGSLSVTILHAEAAALEENQDDFAFNAAYVDRKKRVLRYRGHPFDNAREAHCCVLIGGDPEPEQFQAGRSFAKEGPDEDAFHDALDGSLHGNSLCGGQEGGATSAFLWRRAIPPGGQVRVRVILASGAHTREAEERLKVAFEEDVQGAVDRTRRHWRNWLSQADETLRRVPTVRLRRLARRSLLLLKLLQHEDGAVLAAPTLLPDYRYCWPRDAAYVAWILSRYGYTEEAERFFRWCSETQTAEGFWQQNYYTDGRPHWTALQVDQVGTVLWAFGQHVAQHGREHLARDLWPMVQAAADGLIRLADPETHLVSSPQCLWEECGGTFAYTNAACAAGLQAAASVADQIGERAASAQFLGAARAAVDGIKSALVRDGRVVAELHPERSYHAREEYRLDISVAGLAVPYSLVEADWSPLAHSMEEFAHCFHWPAGGMGRYPGDHFEGGHPWPLCSMWLAAYFLAAGDPDRAMQHLEWALEQVTDLGHFPEQVHKESLHPVSALPLGWAHAWYLWLLDSLYLNLKTAARPAPAAQGRVRSLLERAPLLRKPW